MRFLAGVFAVVLLLSFGHPARAEDPFEINVILPLTGPVAFLGKSELESFGLAEKAINARGGINGRPIKFAVSDDASNPQVAVQLTNAIAAKKATVILGSPSAASCAAMGPIVAKTGPVQYCLAPIYHPPSASYVFSAGVSSVDSAQVVARYLLAKHLTRVAIITATDATGRDMDAAFDSVFAQADNRGFKVVAREHFNPSDISVSAQLARIKAANPQVLFTWTVGTPFGTLLQGIRDSGLAVPVLAAQGVMLYSQMNQLANALPKDLIFAGYRAMSEVDVRPGPIKEAQRVMFRAHRAAGMRPDIAAATLWDPILIVVQAYKALGTNASAEQIRGYISGLHGFAGVNAVYDFRDGNGRGVGANALVMDRWDPATKSFVPISRPGGGLN